MLKASKTICLLSTEVMANSSGGDIHKTPDLAGPDQITKRYRMQIIFSINRRTFIAHERAVPTPVIRAVAGIEFRHALNLAGG